MKGCLFSRWRILVWVVGTAVLLLGCNLTGGAETPPAVIVPTIEAQTGTAEPTGAAADTPAAPGETAVSDPTATTAVLAPTATLPGETQVEGPTPTSEAGPVETTATITATVEPVLAAPGTIAPGQQTSASLENGGRQLYRFQGTEFEPVMVFAEGDDGLDLTLNVYQGEISAGADLSQLSAIATADFSPLGRPEVMIITPNEDGPHTLVVEGGSGSGGGYTLYMYDGTTPAANTRLIPDSLAAGETKSYKALSNGGRPVIVYVDQTGQSDLILQILDDEGEVVTEANFGGENSAEAAFVLPLEETAYTVQVSTAGGETAVYNLVIVTLSE
jgi:hypothetical protein